MLRQLRFRSLQPFCLSGLLEDPLLLLFIKPLGRSILFDCGVIHHLAKRILKSIDAVFISHAHMDHFMGMDTLIRHVHASPTIITIFGPPGITDKMGRKLSAYDWNLTERSWCSFKVVEVHTDHLLTTIYAGPAGFSPEAEREGPRTEMIYENRFLGVRAAICDHKIPTLAFRVDEKPGFTIDERKLQQEGVLKGNWLGLLKNAFYRDTLHKELLTVPCAGGSSCIRTVNGAELYGKIVKEENPPSVGYVTDLAFTEGNMQVLSTLLAGVDLLVCECTFLKAEADKARRSHHLCTTDFNWLLHRLKPHVVIPVHLSKSYLERSSELFREIDPPEEVSVVRLPERITPRPLLLNEIAAFTPPS